MPDPSRLCSQLLLRWLTLNEALGRGRGDWQRQWTEVDSHKIVGSLRGLGLPWHLDRQQGFQQAPASSQVTLKTSWKGPYWGPLGYRLRRLPGEQLPHGSHCQIQSLHLPLLLVLTPTQQKNRGGKGEKCRILRSSYLSQEICGQRPKLGLRTWHCQVV